MTSHPLHRRVLSNGRFLPRTGMTLVEMLVATATSLLIMAAVAQVFSVLGSAVSNSRSLIELDGQLRSVAWRLRSDLKGLTARPLPPLSPQMGEGYLEIIEGPLSDARASHNTSDLAADTDDIVLFTTRSPSTPFRGKANSGYLESPVAEVAWFTRASTATGTPQTYTLYRRQLLVAGYPAVGDFTPGSGNSFVFPGWSAFYESYDLSVRREAGKLLPNTLSDLTRRESRFLHNPNGITDGSGFPYLLDASQSGVWFDPSTSNRTGEDVILTNVLAFDVRVFDPAGPVVVAGEDALVPKDPGFPASPGINAFGSYADLGHGVTTSAMASAFAGQGQGNYRGQAIGLYGQRIWDTWSDHYETNGYDENRDGTADEGADGLDSADPSSGLNRDGIVDDLREWETSPPYPAPLRGIEIRIRCYEPSSRQIRQVTIRHTFVSQ